MSELAEKLVVEANSPILAQKLNDVWDQSVIVPFAYFVQVIVGKANEGHKGWDNNLLAAEVGDVLDHPVRVD